MLNPFAAHKQRNGMGYVRKKVKRKNIQKTDQAKPMLFVLAVRSCSIKH